MIWQAHRGQCECYLPPISHSLQRLLCLSFSAVHRSGNKSILRHRGKKIANVSQRTMITSSGSLLLWRVLMALTRVKFRLSLNFKSLNLNSCFFLLGNNSLRVRSLLFLAKAEATTQFTLEVLSELFVTASLQAPQSAQIHIRYVAS